MKKEKILCMTKKELKKYIKDELKEGTMILIEEETKVKKAEEANGKAECSQSKTRR